MSKKSGYSDGECTWGDQREPVRGTSLEIGSLQMSSC